MPALHYFGIKCNQTKVCKHQTKESKGLSMFFFLFFNRLLSFVGPQLYSLVALSFTYGQHVVLELADKRYNSVTVCFCASRKYVFHIGLKRKPNMD